MDTTSNFTAGSTAGNEYQHTEGTVAKSIEQQTAKLPSDAFLWVALGAMAGSAALQMTGKQHVSLFVGQWVPTLLLFGLYNKLVKQLGSDRVSRHSFSGATAY